ncbi:VG15 protein [Streptomyces scabiei]|uniref:VG15 protein n=1 Tax=Streptomyces scabiei TaxID=1930 RepID=UPI0038F7275E
MSDAADARYRQVQSLALAVVARVQSIWSGLDPANILASLQADQGGAILDAVVAGQLTAAEGAQAFVAQAMAARGAAARAAATVDPAAFAGIASDGRPLPTLLFQPAITTYTTLAAGADPRTALLAGMNQMAMMVSTQIADASRAATSVAMTAHPRCVSYVRVVKLPACGRCIVLAGRQYSYSTGFQRHPKCDCGMDPTHSDEEWRAIPGPEELVAQMSPQEQRRRLGAAAVEALAKGADLAQVVNARRGMQTLTGGRKGPTTTEGTTLRGIAGKRLAIDLGADKLPRQRYRRSNAPRLMPEEILRQTKGSSREEQLRLLKLHGYIY